jgi:hypothetical protein
MSFNFASAEERGGGDCRDVWRDAFGFQVPSEDSEEVTGIRGCENEPGLVAASTGCLSYCWVIRISF